MKRALPLLLSASALIASSAFGQNIKLVPSAATRIAVPRSATERGISQSSSIEHSLLKKLSPAVAVSGADPIVSGRYEFQTNGRGLHNIQVDPDHPERVHAVIMTTIDNTVADTVKSAFPGRRCLYTYSGDGGHTWSTPVALGSIRTGYPSMVLAKRNGTYIPIIAAHRADPSRTGEFISALFVEKGAPGTGNFEEIDASNMASNGAVESLLWPTIDVNPTEATTTKVYIAADYSNQTDSKDIGYLEFGSFTLNADGTGTFDGWTSEPGSAAHETVSGSGMSTVGKHVIHVAPNGTIGVAWINPNADILDHAMYFVESTDQGKTWPVYGPLLPAANLLTDQDGNDINRGVAPNYGIDFMYDANNVPHFVAELDMQIINNSDSNGYYFPYTGQIAYWTPGAPGLQILNYVEQGLVINRLAMNGATTPDSVYYLYQADYFDPATIPTGTKVEFPSPSVLAYPTLARTSNPNVWSVFYQTIQSDLNADVINENDTKKEWYSAIYYQTTSDGGATWSAPKAFHSNDVQGDPTKWVDYRFPETSNFNPFNAGVAEYTTMFSADSSAGQWGGGGEVGWDNVTWYHQQFGASRVETSAASSATMKLLQNYPNPFNPSTTIAFTLAQPSAVELTVEDMMGRPVATVVSGHYGMGEHTVSYNAQDLSSGVYRYTLRANGEVVSKTMTLLK